MGKSVVHWTAQSKDDIIHAEILELLFNCVRAKGIIYREFQKAGIVEQSSADEFISHVLILYEATDVLVGVKDKKFQKVMEITNDIRVRLKDAEDLFKEIKKGLKSAGIFNVRKGAQFTNAGKGRGMIIGTQ